MDCSKIAPMFLTDVEEVTITFVITMSRMCGRGRCSAQRTRIPVLYLFSFNLLHITQASISLAQASIRDTAAAVSSRVVLNEYEVGNIQHRGEKIDYDFELSNDVTKWGSV